MSNPGTALIEPCSSLPGAATFALPCAQRVVSLSVHERLERVWRGRVMGEHVWPRGGLRARTFGALLRARPFGPRCAPAGGRVGGRCGSIPGRHHPVQASGDTNRVSVTIEWHLGLGTWDMKLET